MKTSKFYILSILLSLFIVQCKNSEENKSNLSKSILEKAAEAAGMPNVEGPSVQNASKNKVSLDFDFTKLNTEFDFTDALGSVTASKEVISIIIVKEVKGGVRSITIGFTGNDLREQKPISAEIGSENQVNATFSIQKLDNTNVVSFLANQGSVEVTKLTEEKALIKFDVKLSNAMDSQDESKWIDLKGMITIDYPLITTLGDDKNEFLY